jgi:hypothetical protein
MRVLLHNYDTRLFYAGSDQWTSDASLALNFGSIQQAVDAYRERKICFAEILVDAGPGAGRIPFSLPDQATPMIRRA